MARISHIEFQLMAAALRYDMDGISLIVNSLTPEQRSGLSLLAIEEAMNCATRYIAVEPMAGASAIIALMRTVGFRLRPETMEQAMNVFPDSYPCRTVVQTRLA